MDHLTGSLQRNVSFIRMVHDWEVYVIASFYLSFYSQRHQRKGEDKLWWIPSCKGKFDVRSFYKRIASKESSPFPWESIW
jgi:hypothetical protein